MAQTTYTSPNPVTLGQRAAVYRKIAEFVVHLDPLNLNLLVLQLNGNNTISFTLNNPLPSDQRDHLGLTDWVVT